MRDGPEGPPRPLRRRPPAFRRRSICDDVLRRWRVRRRPGPEPIIGDSTISFTGGTARGAGCGLPKARPGARPWLSAQIAAWVRLAALILRSRLFMWTFTVASVMSKRLAITLFASPFTRQRRISISRRSEEHTSEL